MDTLYNHHQYIKYTFRSNMYQNPHFNPWSFDEFQINVTLRTSGFDNKVLSVDACTVWWEHESFYCLPRLGSKCADWVNLKFVYTTFIWSVKVTHGSQLLTNSSQLLKLKYSKVCGDTIYWNNLTFNEWGFWEEPLVNSTYALLEPFKTWCHHKSYCIYSHHA